ncbi:MAG: hypothetical protein WCA45_00680 [Thiobacillaceae bacterium]
MQVINDRPGLGIALKDEGDGERVVCFLENGREIHLTLVQARMLATDLIGAVNRAEVRHNLKREDNLSRSGAATPSAIAAAASSI